MSRELVSQELIETTIRHLENSSRELTPAAISGGSSSKERRLVEQYAYLQAIKNGPCAKDGKICPALEIRRKIGNKKINDVRCRQNVDQVNFWDGKMPTIDEIPICPNPPQK